MTPPTRPSRDLVFTLYGDYLLGRRDPVWVGSLITLLGQLGLSPASVRTALSRMTHKGWLAAERRGLRSYYGLTKRGRRLLESGRERIYHRPRHEAWDGTWHLVSYSIPESDRHRRDQFRVKLLWLGCGPLGNGLWLSPYDVRAAVAEISETLKVARYTEVFRADHVGFSTVDQLVAQCWDLAAINRRYAAFVARWSPFLNHCVTCRLAAAGGDGGEVRHPCTSPEGCFVRRFQLVHEYRAFPMEDPFLPASLLPAGWKGEEAAHVFETYHAVLADPAERYVDQICRAGDIVESEPAA
jgi:phenylacetic acid degradation operon negative regulatory protein